LKLLTTPPFFPKSLFLQLTKSRYFCWHPPRSVLTRRSSNSPGALLRRKRRATAFRVAKSEKRNLEEAR